MEFIRVQPEKKKLNWFRLANSNYVELKPSAGVHRSHAFPGLWLDGNALLAGASSRVLEVLREGLETPQHTKFKAELAARKKK